MPDRAMFLFGGQFGDILYNDLWQFNVNTAMWDKVVLEDARIFLARHTYIDDVNAQALNTSDLYLSAY